MPSEGSSLPPPHAACFSPPIDGSFKKDFSRLVSHVGIDMDVTFASLIVHVINQIILLKGATESCCSRGELWGSPEGLITAPALPPHLVGKCTPA